MRFVLVSLILLLGFVPEAVSGTRNCLSSVKPLGLIDVAERSRYIAVYFIEEISIKTGTKEGRSKYSYQLSRYLTVKGDAPGELIVDGLPPYQHVPAHFFGLNIAHEKQIASNQGGIGNTPIVFDDEDNKCRFMATGMQGYYILVFENRSSTWSLEPVVTPYYDPLVEYLRKKYSR